MFLGISAGWDRVLVAPRARSLPSPATPALLSARVRTHGTRSPGAGSRKHFAKGTRPPDRVARRGELRDRQLSTSPRRFLAPRGSPHPGPPESWARLAPFSSESPARPRVGCPRAPGDGRGQRGGLRHLVPEPWGGGRLPGQAGAVRPHPPAGSRHLPATRLYITHRPRSHDG